MTNLSQVESEIIFQHWVVTERNDLTYLSPKERLTCPLLWCGIDFDDHDSLLRHLKDCPQLSTSGYWCPRCHRAESFASNKIPGSDCQSPVQKKPSRLKKLLRKPFSRKRASIPSQDSTIRPNSLLQGFHSNHIRETDNMNLHSELDHYVPRQFSIELEADIRTWEQQRDTFSSSDTHNINTPSFERYEKDGNSMILSELPGPDSDLFINGGAELSMLSQSNIAMEKEVVDSHADEYSCPTMPIPFSGPVSGQFDPQDYTGVHIPGNASPGSSSSNEHLDMLTPGFLSPEHEELFQKTIADVCNQAARPGHISQNDGLNPASGLLDHQHIPIADRSGYSPFHTSNLAEVQTPCDHLYCFDHAPRSAPYVSPHRQKLAHIGIRPTMDPLDTVNVSAGGQLFRQGHPNPETGPENSPLSTSSDHTNTTSSSESAGTAITPVTPFSSSGSPIGLSPPNISNSPARSSGSPQENGFTCKRCGRAILDRSNFKRHVKETHDKVVRTICRLRCGKTFSRQGNEDRHYHDIHLEKRAKGDTKRRKARPSRPIHPASANSNFS